MVKTKDITTIRARNEVLRQDLKIKEALLMKYIQCFRSKAQGKLPSSQIEQIIKNVLEFEDDLEKNDY